MFAGQRCFSLSFSSEAKALLQCLSRTAQSGAQSPCSDTHRLGNFFHRAAAHQLRANRAQFGRSLRYESDEFADEDLFVLILRAGVAEIIQFLVAREVQPRAIISPFPAVVNQDCMQIAEEVPLLGIEVPDDFVQPNTGNMLDNLTHVVLCRMPAASAKPHARESSHCSPVAGFQPLEHKVFLPFLPFGTSPTGDRGEALIQSLITGVVNFVLADGLGCPTRGIPRQFIEIKPQPQRFLTHTGHLLDVERVIYLAYKLAETLLRGRKSLGRDNPVPELPLRRISFRPLNSISFRLLIETREQEGITLHGASRRGPEIQPKNSRPRNPFHMIFRCKQSA